MGKQAGRFTYRFTAQVVLDAVKGVKTLAALSPEYRVHPNQIASWKKLLLSKAPSNTRPP